MVSHRIAIRRSVRGYVIVTLTSKAAYTRRKKGHAVWPSRRSRHAETSEEAKCEGEERRTSCPWQCQGAGTSKTQPDMKMNVAWLRP